MVSLAVKYRPKSFDDVIGQEITLDILKNQLKNDTLASTIGFFGASGCGKTTVARIVSNMVNEGQGHPIEIDAASNNSVDNVRQIIENASQRSLDSKYKIFIVDECFLPGSMISTIGGDVPIEKLKRKSKIATINGFSVVNDVIKKQVPTSHLINVKLSNGKVITTTKDHLFFTNSGWIEAQNLIAGDELFDFVCMQGLWKDILQSTGQGLILQQPVPNVVSSESREEISSTDRESLSGMWSTIYSEHSVFAQKDSFQGLYANIYIAVKCDDSELRIWDGVKEIIFRKNEETESNEQPKSNREDETYERIEWDSACLACGTWGKWSLYRSPDAIISELRRFLGIRVRSKYESYSKRKSGEIPVCVQSRPWLQKNEISGRGGWQFSSIEKTAVSRYKENGCLGKVRVESIEVYKPGNTDRCEKCSEDYTTVYDLNVLGSPTYFVNGVLVHNCHAITSQGWAAFLKLLEEPNKYTKFIFCTTNPEKIPDTVISRMQIFNFTKVDDLDIINRLKYICKLENILITDESLEFIVRVSNGSVRQSITNLEKCINLSKDLSYNSIINVIGSGSYDLMSDLLLAIFNNDYSLAINIVETVYKSGKDLRQFIFELLKFALDLYKVIIFGDFSLTSIPKTDKISSLLMYKNKFNKFITFISDFYENNKQASEIRFLFEANLLKVCDI